MITPIKERVCGECDGKGRITVTHKSPDKEMKIERSCPACGGTGKAGLRTK